MSKIDYGGSALPVPGTTIPGMSLRDYFAAHAMQATATATMIIVAVSTSRGDTCNTVKWDEIALGAYGLADAMIAESRKVK